jgi:outer membrane protein OmpA-like peptidoglycan-associated protein
VPSHPSSCPGSRSAFLRASALALACALQGCTTPTSPTAPPRPAAPPASAVDQRAAAPAALATEKQWLQSWFTGTPVLIALRSDGAVTVDVPREFSFDAGRSSVKPPLGAVLDKVAESLRRTPLARLPLVAAPADPDGASALALQRATQVRAHLLARGVPAARLANPTAAAASAVQLRMEVASP